MSFDPIKLSPSGAEIYYSGAYADATGATGAGGQYASTASSQGWDTVTFKNAATRVGIGSALPTGDDISTSANYSLAPAVVIGGTTPIGDVRGEGVGYIAQGGSSTIIPLKPNEFYSGALYATYAVGSTAKLTAKVGVGTAGFSSYYQGNFTTRDNYAFDTVLNVDTGNLNATGSGSGVYTIGDTITLQTSLIDRIGDSLNTVSSINDDAFVKGINISILNEDKSIAYSNYKTDYKNPSFTFTKQENIDIFGSFTENFGVKFSVENQDGQTHETDFLLYGNRLSIEKIYVSASGGTYLDENKDNDYGPSTSDIVASDDKLEAVVGFSHRLVNTSGTTGAINFNITFDQDPNFTNYDNLLVFANTGSSTFDTTTQNLLGTFPLSQLQNQNVRIFPDDGIVEGESNFFKFVASSEVGFYNELFTVGPYSIEPVEVGTDPILYNVGEQEIVSGNLSILGQDAGGLYSLGASGSGDGQRLTGPGGLPYLLSGDSGGGGGGSDDLQDVTDRGAVTTTTITAASFTGNNGLTQLKGSTDDANGYVLKTRNYANDDLFNVRNDGHVGIGSLADNSQVYITSPNAIIKLGTSDGYSIKSEEKAILGVVSGDVFSTGSALLGGSGHLISGDYDVIAGGVLGTISGGDYDFIGGGYDLNVNHSEYSVVAGGKTNSIFSGDYSVIGGGLNNLITGIASDSHVDKVAIVGGEGNKVISAPYTFIGAGNSNLISGTNSLYSAILGGGYNQIKESQFATILGGDNNRISFANHSVSAGNYSRVLSGHNGAFVFSDSRTANYDSPRGNTLSLRFQSGVFVDTDSGIYINGNPVITGSSASEGDTLQTVTDRGATTTNNILSTGPHISGVTGLFSDKVGIGTNDPAYALTVNAGTTNQIARFISSDPDAVIGIQDNTDAVFLGHDAALDVMSLGFNSSMGTSSNLNIDTAGHVGIGTNNPNAELEIAASVATIRLTDSDLTNTFSEIEKGGDYLYFYSRANSSNGGFLFAGDNGTTETEFMRIATDGDVGIGSNTPSAKLDVAGGIKLLDNNYLAWNSSNTRIVGNSDYLQLQVAASDKVRIQSDGNVGIGTNTPRTTLHVSKAGTTEGGIVTIDNPNTTDGSYCGIEFINSTVGYPRSAIFAQRTGGYDAELTFHTSDANLITGSDYPDATERMRIDHDGNVGIGSNNPNASLDVGGSMQVKGETSWAGTDNQNGAIFMDTAGRGLLGAFSTSYARPLITANSNYIDLGSAGTSLINGFRFYAGSSSASPGTYDFYTSGSNNRLHIAKGGNIGLNTTSPKAKLHIEGDKSYSLGYLDATSDLHIGNDTMSSAVGAYAGSITFGSTNESNLQAASIVAIQTDTDPNEIGLAFFTQHSQFGSTDLAESMRISNDGKVGIGTTNTLTRLVVDAPMFRGGTNPSGMIVTDSANGAMALELGVDRTNSASYIESRHTGSNTSYTLLLNAGYGKVGVGTVSPTSKFEVGTVAYGTDSIAKFWDGTDGVEITNRGGSRQQINFLGSNTSAINASGSLFINYDGDNNGTNDTITFARNGADENGTVDMVIKEGDVGIGTNSPISQFHITGASPVLTLNSPSSDFSRIDFVRGTTAAKWDINHTAAGDLKFRENTYTKLTLYRGNGRVGIGSEIPAYTLDVAGDIQAKDSVVLAGTQAARGYSFHDLGTTWGYKALTSPGRLAVLVQGIESMTFESNGRVGIGSTNPAHYKLEVIGDISGSGSFFGTGDGGRITKDNVPYLLSGDAAASLTLQQVTDNGATTTKAIKSQLISITGGGTDSPVGVNGLHLTYDGTSTAYINAQHNGTSNRHLIFKAASYNFNIGDLAVNTDTLYVDVSEDRVGIGIASPKTLLDVDGAANHGIRIGTNNALIGEGGATGTQLLFWNGTSAYYGRSAAPFTHTVSNHYFRVGGSDQMAITSAGVGIGTASPDTKLHVKGTAIRFEEAGGSTRHFDIIPATAGVNHKFTSDSTSAGYEFYNNANSLLNLTNTEATFNTSGENIDFRVKSSGSTAIFVDASIGTVGINQSSPSSTYALDVGGSIRMATAAPSLVLRETDSSNQEFSVFGLGGDFFIRDITQSTYPLKIEAGVANDTLVLESGGNVGIGTNDPLSKLHVKGAVRVERTVTTDSSYLDMEGNFRYIAANGYAHAFFSNGSESVRISSAGNVGIGTASPSETLHVLGTTRLGGRGYTGGASIEYASFSETNGGASTIVGNAVYAGNANNTFRKTRSDAGNYIQLNYNKGITFHTNVTGSASSSEYDINSHEQMRLTTGGLLGIGTDDPEQPLHVAATNYKPALIQRTAGTNCYLLLEDQNTTLDVGVGATTNDLKFRAGNSDHMKLDAGGDLFLGSPTDSADKLMVQANTNYHAARFNGHTDGGQSYGVRIRAGTNSVDYGLLIENTAGADLFKVDGVGDVTGAGNFYGTGAGNRITNDGTPYLLSGDAAAALTLQDVTDNGSTTTNNMEIQGAGSKSFTVDSTDGHASVVIDRHSTSYDANLSFQTNGATKWRLWNNSNDTTFAIRDEVNASNVMTWEVGGNVGIGLEDPSTKLQTLGTISGATGLFENAKISNFNSSDYAAFGHENVADDSYAIRQHSNGNVHINCGSSRLIQFRHQNSTQGGFNASKDFFVGPSETNNTFHVDISETNVGVGTYAPLGKLTVATTMSSSPTTQLYLDVDGSNTVGGGGEVIFNTSASAGALDAYNAIVRGQRSSLNDGSSDLTFLTTHVPTSATAAARMTIKDDGKVGIGTISPSYELDVIGTTRSTYYIGGAYFEENASSSKIKFYPNGTILVLDEDGQLKPSEKENDTLVFGVSKRDFEQPIVLGAEPILITGPIEVGDYIVTSNKQGHGQAMKENKFGTVIAQAMEKGDGESYNIKAMIRKM